ncbi:MAG: condensation domain-containing protein [Thermoleophilaceae bacterium]
MGTAGAERSLDFTVLEETILHVQGVTNPWNIQFEIGSGARLDAERLKDAVATACSRHPLARVRQSRDWSPVDRRYSWEVASELEQDPLRVADVGDEDALEELRTDFYSPPIALEASPPVRAALARGPERDLVLLNTSHVPLDGVGTARLAQSIARSYRGVEDPPDPVSLDAARDLGSLLSPESLGERLTRAMDNVTRALTGVDPPAKVAPVGAGEREGFGFVHRRIPAERTAALLRERPPGATFNDVLLAALHLTIDRWNAEHDETARRISVTMPVNARPREWYWEMPGMYAILLSVATTPGQRKDLPTATAAVSDQTNQLKQGKRLAAPFDVLRLAEGIAVGVKRAMPLLIPVAGDRFADSAVLSNLGRIPDPPRFEESDGDAPPELWFSPPCGMPIGVSVGAATVGDVLHLSVRHRFAQFDRAAAAEFADLLLAQLGSSEAVAAS